MYIYPTRYLTDAVKEAFKHVKELHPECHQVVFDIEGRWHYLNEEFEIIEFNGKEDGALLEDAVDSVHELPVAFSLLSQII